MINPHDQDFDLIMAKYAWCTGGMTNGCWIIWIQTLAAGAGSVHWRQQFKPAIITDSLPTEAL